MKKQIQFIYQLSNDLEYEMIDTDDTYLNSILKEVEEYYSLPCTLNNDKLKKQLILGNIAFYLLDSPNLDFDKETIAKMKLINTFLSCCITNSKYCNNKIFLAFVRDILNYKIPEGDIFASNYYMDINDISNIETNEKLNLMLNNVKHIKINKTYICNGVIDLIIVSIFEIFAQGYSIKRCRNCHKYFFNKNSNKYCPYSSLQKHDKSCYEYCTNTSYLEKRENDPIRKEYNKISNMLRSRYRYYEKDSDREILSNFGDNYRSKMEDLNNGLISKEDVIEFLNMSKMNFTEQYKKHKEERKNGSTRTNKK